MNDEHAEPSEPDTVEPEGEQAAAHAAEHAAEQAAEQAEPSGETQVPAEAELLGWIEIIESQPLDQRAAGFEQLHDELLAELQRSDRDASGAAHG